MSHSADAYCCRPSHKILRRFKTQLTPNWKDIGYELIKPEDIDCIDCSKPVEEEKCFAMLKKWLETEPNPCYCKFFKALNMYKLFCLVYELKSHIRMQQ